MAIDPVALSIQHFINSVGAKAGFASIIGLALLVLCSSPSRGRPPTSAAAPTRPSSSSASSSSPSTTCRARVPAGAAPAAGADDRRSRSRPARGRPGRARPRRRAPVPGEQAAAGGGGVATIPAAPAGVGGPRPQLRHAPHPAGRARRDLDPRAQAFHERPERRRGRCERHRGRPPGGGGLLRRRRPPPAAATAWPARPRRSPCPPWAARLPLPLRRAQPHAPPPRVALPRQRVRPGSPPPTGRRARRGASGRRVSPVFFVLAGILAVAVVAAVLVSRGRLGQRQLVVLVVGDVQRGVGNHARPDWQGQAPRLGPRLRGPVRSDRRGAQRHLDQQARRRRPRQADDRRLQGAAPAERRRPDAATATIVGYTRRPTSRRARRWPSR